MYFALCVSIWLLVLLNSPAYPQVTRTGTDSYEEDIKKSGSIKDTQDHCGRVQEEIKRLTEELNSCQAKVADVTKQPDPASAEVTPADIQPIEDNP